MSMSIVPEIAGLLSQFTENPGWANLPTEPTGITRVDEDTWKINVGDYSRTFTKEELQKHIKSVLQPDSDESELQS